LRKYSDVEHIKQIERIVEHLPLVAVSTYAEQKVTMFGIDDIPSCYAKRFVLKLPKNRTPYITLWYHESRDLASVGGVGLNMYYIFKFCPAIEELFRLLPSPAEEPDKNIIATW